MAKFEVIHTGARREGKALEVGTVVKVEGELPPSLVGKVRPLSDESGKVLEVGTPAKGGKGKADAPPPPPVAS